MQYSRFSRWNMAYWGWTSTCKPSKACTRTTPGVDQTSSCHYFERPQLRNHCLAWVLHGPIICHNQSSIMSRWYHLGKQWRSLSLVRSFVDKKRALLSNHSRSSEWISYEGASWDAIFILFSSNYLCRSPLNLLYLSLPFYFPTFQNQPTDRTDLSPTTSLSCFGKGQNY